ncbi:MAG: AI-2E family transporter [Clostridia bacterium]|nr:AI-2E family transporter [Clostridia bacterium]
MDKDVFKKYILIATYIVLLYLVLSHLDVVISSLGFLYNVVKPIVIGACIMFVMNVLLKKYEKVLFKKGFPTIKNGAKLKRVICILLTYATFAAFIVILCVVVVPQVAQSVRSLAESLPGYLSAANTGFMDFVSRLGLPDNIWETIRGFWDQFESSFSDIIKSAAGTAIDATVTATKAIINFLIGLIFAAYMLFAKEKLVKITKKLCYAIFKGKAADKIIEIAAEANVTFARFIGGQLLEAVILGALCFIGMLILRLPYAPLIACLIGATSLIPVLGAYLGTIPSAFIILMVDPIKALVFVIFIIVLQQIENNFIYPKVVGNAIGLEGLWVFAAIVIGSGLGGVMGMLVGVPLMAVIYSLVRTYTALAVEKRGVDESKYDAQAAAAIMEGTKTDESASDEEKPTSSQ